MTRKEKEAHERDVLASILDGIRNTTRAEWLEQIRGYEAEYAGEPSPLRVEWVRPAAMQGNKHQTLRRHKPTVVHADVTGE
jgi:hypothetical protein